MADDHGFVVTWLIYKAEHVAPRADDPGPSGKFAIIRVEQSSWTLPGAVTNELEIAVRPGRFGRDLRWMVSCKYWLGSLTQA